MKTIPLSNGLSAMVDDEDYERVQPFNWRPLQIGPKCYAVANVAASVQVYLHRFILGFGRGDLEVDHKDHNGLNCTRENMRPATRSQNAQNLVGANCKSSTGARNVAFDKRRNCYYVRLGLNNQKHHIGTFKTLEEADQVARAARARLMTHSAENVA